MGHRNNQSTFVFPDGLGYDVRKYENYTINLSGEESNKDGHDRLQKDEQNAKMTSDYGNSGLPSGNNNNSLDSENDIKNANIVRLLSFREIPTIYGKLMTNDWRVRPLADCHCSMNTEEGNRENSERDKLLKNETARKTFEEITARAMKSDDDTSIMHPMRDDAWMIAVLEDTTHTLARINKGCHEPVFMK